MDQSTSNSVQASPSNGYHHQTETITYMSLDLYKAAEDGKIDPFKNFAGPLDLLVTPIKDTILHLNLASPSERSTSFVKEALDMCPQILLQINADGDTLLHIAARYGHLDIVKLLIEHTRAQHQDLESAGEAVRQMLRMTNKSKETALHEAARNDHPDLVELLIEQDPDFVHSSNDFGETPLYLASERGHLEVVVIMLKACTSLAYGGPNGKTALHAAAMHRHGGIVHAILDKKTSLVNKADEMGWTPLHYAAYIGASRVVKQLLGYDKYVAYAADKARRRTALHLAACQANIKSMREIIFKCPDCCKLVDNRGWNVAHYAVISKSDDALKILLANPSCIYLVNEKDAQGNTPLHLLAALQSHPRSLMHHAKGHRFAVYRQNFLCIKELLSRSPCRKSYQKEIQEWMRDLGGGPLGQIVIKKDDFILTFERARDSHIVVAALVATVTFAAAFTLPGGYRSNDDEKDQGVAILGKNSAFKAFLITDAIAMVLSTSSLFIHFTLALHGYRQRFMWLMVYAFRCIVFAIEAMVVAFVTGTYAVLSPSQGLAISTCAIGLSFFIFVFFILTRINSTIFKFSGI
eukprot:XP_015583393.1 ankyrin repeat-containing protein NPR4 isoform X1 [Ricinus communis]